MGSWRGDLTTFKEESWLDLEEFPLDRMMEGRTWMLWSPKVQIKLAQLRSAHRVLHTQPNHV